MGRGADPLQLPAGRGDGRPSRPVHHRSGGGGQRGLFAALTVRRAEAGGRLSEAIYSPCERWRYRLTRRWGDGAPVLWVMLNPSTATEVANDPTIERCERRSRAMGFGALDVVNLFAYRATRPADLFVAEDPVGAACDAILAEAAKEAGLIVAGWGHHGTRFGRDREVAALLSGLSPSCLGVTKAGQPRHPLYVGYGTGPRPWTP